MSAEGGLRSLRNVDLEGKPDFNSPSECVQPVGGGTPWLMVQPDPSQGGLQWFIFHIKYNIKYIV